MKHGIILLLFILVGSPLLAEDLNEPDYVVEGDRMIGQVLCTNEPIFRVALSSKIKKGVYTRISLIPYDTDIVSFEILRKPNRMDAIHASNENNNTKTLVWTPVIDFPEDAREFIKVKPVYANDSLARTASCRSYTIELPLHRDQAPKLSIIKDHFVEPIVVSGRNIAKKYNLKGGNEGEKLLLFQDEELESLDIIITTGHQKVREDELDEGILEVVHSGVVPEGQNESISIELFAKDKLRQQSEQVTLTFRIVPDHAVEPVFSLCDANKERELPDHQIAYERQPLVVESFKAINPATYEKCDIEIASGSILNYKIDTEKDQFTWTPSEDFLKDTRGEELVETEILFKAVTRLGGESQCKLVFKVANHTSERGEEDFRQALALFEQSEKEFLKEVRTPLCYLERASVQVAKNKDQVEQITDIYNSADGILAITATANPVATGVYAGVGLIINALEKIGSKKAIRVKVKGEQLQEAIKTYKDLTTKFAQYQGQLKNFKTDEECTELLNLSKQVEAALATFKTQVPGFISITTIFNKKIERRIVDNCKF